MTGTPTIELVSVERLRLDPLNPRLPEALQGEGQSALLGYLAENAVLDELMQSFADNGFFQHEPLIGVPDGDEIVVLEGNRRLSALKILLQSPEAMDLGLEATLEGPLEDGVANELHLVPTYVVSDRNEVHKYLGFRHIGGIKTWSAEAKARYLMLETDRAAHSESENPFLEVARRVGSNSMGIRNAYTSIKTLRVARDEFGIDVNDVLRRRFGVWTRCMTAANVRHYIGLNGSRDYAAVVREISELDREPLAEVIDDLSVRGDQLPVLRDSRLVTVYGQILQNDHARAVLRSHRNLDVARQIVEMAELPTRVEDLRSRVLIARDEAERAEWSEELAVASEGLFRGSRALMRAVQDLKDDAP